MSTTPNNFDSRLSRLEAAHKELEDAFIIMTHLETKMGQALKEQAQYIASHESRLRDVDARIEKLVSAIGAFISQRTQ